MTNQDAEDATLEAIAEDTFNVVKAAAARKNPPFYTTSEKFGRSQKVSFCNTCGDTSFGLLNLGKETNQCCRCGKEY